MVVIMIGRKRTMQAMNRLERRLAFLALGDRCKVHHHDAVLLDQPDEHDHADERVETEDRT